MLGWLLFIIFGSKIREKDYGPAYPMKCSHCQEDVFYHAYKWRKWYHIFWIPLIPATANRYLICPLCNSYIPLTRKAFKKAGEVVRYTRRYERDVVTDEQYDDALRRFERSMAFLEEAPNRDDTTDPFKQIEETPDHDFDDRGFH